MIRQRVAGYIENEGLFSLSDKVIVALSGGADSVALLRILLSLGYTCEAAHCNFHLRAEESNRDEEFVQTLCQKLNVPLHRIDFDTHSYAEEQKISIEMAARELRYNWFAEIREKQQAAVVAVAHHRDDSVETILLNLIRGTGINGLRGIQPRNREIVRPLLCVTRDELIDYLQHIKQEYVTDSTNLQDEYTRNKIRLNLLPLMQEINPSVKESIANTGKHLDGVASIYKASVEESKARVMTPEGVDIARLLQENSPASVLFEILHPLGFNPAQVNDIFQSLKGQPGKQFAGKGRWRALKDREMLFLYEENEQNDPPFVLHKSEHTYTTDFVIPRDKQRACFDTEKLKEPLHIRKWNKGDIFYPFGMKGKKKVSDYLTDRKFSLLQKENQWVLCCGEEIVWLIGERTDNRYRVESETRRVLMIEVDYFF
ncbi:tRNA lysidine(34) synthetase TilS [Bacteroides sp. OttesenSCG-928-F21]|nr:tRNA lysidine(34) synthetase TilS [Bacteroides sp. OttesenSCG-928-F21]